MADGLLSLPGSSDLTGLLAQFQPSAEDAANARKQAQLQFFLGLLGAPKGGEFQRLGQSGIAAMNNYQDQIKQQQALRGQNLAQAVQAYKLLKDAQFTDMGMSMLNPTAAPAGPAAPTAAPATPSAAPSGATTPPLPPQQVPTGVPSYANPRTELGFALAGKKDVADVIHRQYQVTQGPGGTLIRNGTIVGQVIPNAGMVIDGQFQALPKEATDALVSFNTAQKRGEVQAQAEADLIPVPIGNGQTKMMTRADAAKLFSQQPAQQPSPQQAQPTPYSLQGNFTPQELARIQNDAQVNGAQPFNGRLGVPMQQPQAGMGGLGVTPNPLAMKQQEAAINTQAQQNNVIAEGQGKDFLNIIDSEKQAPGNIAKYQLMKDWLGKVDTGKLAPTVLGLKSVASYIAPNLTKDWTKDVPYAQAVSALSNEIALQLRNPAGGAGMPGSMSDSDRNFLTSMAANTSDTPQAIQLKLDMRIALEKRSQQIGQIARNYRQQHGTLDEGFYQAVQDFANTHPLFNNIQSQVSAAQPNLQSIADEMRRRGLIK